MKKSLGSLLLLSLSLAVFAKSSNPLCEGVETAGFNIGDGSVVNPYLVCNQLQLEQLAEDPLLLSNSFKLGADLSFEDMIFKSIGSKTTPFTGTFDGDGYTLSSITLTLQDTDESRKYVAPFAKVSQAKIENLTIDGLTLSEFGLEVIGGMVGEAENSILRNLRVKGLDLKAPNRSGGLVGQTTGSIVMNCSTEGVMTQNFGTDASGGLIGRADDTDVSFSSSKVSMLQSSESAYGVSGLGGLIGIAVNSRIRNVYASGDLDYSSAIEIDDVLPVQIGGLIGAMGNCLLEYAYYAGKILVVGNDVGGVVGTTGALFKSTPGAPSTVFWDIQLSNLDFSAVGEGIETESMKSNAFWESRGFDTNIWSLTEGTYPSLFGE